jgi:hypothetical protein
LVKKKFIKIYIILVIFCPLYIFSNVTFKGFFNDSESAGTLYFISINEYIILFIQNNSCLPIYFTPELLTVAGIVIGDVERTVFCTGATIGSEQSNKSIHIFEDVPLL